MMKILNYVPNDFFAWADFTNPMSDISFGQQIVLPLLDICNDDIENP